MLPRWRGFNLLQKFSMVESAEPLPFERDDFAFIADHGFDFVRLPMDYRFLLKNGQPFVREDIAWDHVMQAIEFGREFGVHVNLCMHRAPGYCCNKPFDVQDLFVDGASQELFTWLWRQFAEKTVSYGAEQVSFNLLNEPPPPAREQEVAAVMRVAVREIHAVRSDRVVICDGLCWGRWGGAGVPSFALTNDAVAQSVHCYEPAWLTFYQMNKEDAFLNGPLPTWPGRLDMTPDQCPQYPHELYMLGTGRWDKAVLRDYFLGPWRGLQATGVGLHAGEIAVFKNTPHAVTLAYMEDLLAILRDMKVGWALWNLRGKFGLINSKRSDADYAHTALGELDIKMLDLLQRY